MRSDEWPVGGQVDRAAGAPQLCQVFGEGLELPAHAALQHLERHALHLREVAHRQLAVLRPARRDREAAVADDRGRHAQRRRRAGVRVPRELGVVVGVAVDDAGHQREAVGVDDLRGVGGQRGRDGADAPGAHGEVGADRVGTAAVVDGGVADQQVVHGSLWRLGCAVSGAYSP
ncbi:MAG TPA: hypothetical protein VLE94_22200 [Burkholderiaceae bacterium]|nr:hypothetical protein [Burkholderiaceae bacterium]